MSSYISCVCELNWIDELTWILLCIRKRVNEDIQICRWGGGQSPKGGGAVRRGVERTFSTVGRPCWTFSERKGAVSVVYTRSW